MTFVVNMQITADGKVAQAEVRKTRSEVESLGTASEGMGRKGRKAAGDLTAMAGSADRTEREIRQLITAERTAGQVALQTGNHHRVAAGQMGNLVAQFNDVGMMLAAGQNPLQLALQQGTQITQVIGPMGAAGAAKALGGAFLSMLSPINLVTIGSIAAGAALTQWLVGGGEEAMKLEDRIEATRAAMEAFSESSEKSRLSVVGMREEFGTADPVLRGILADMAALQKVDLYQSLDAQADGIRNLVLDLSFWDDRSGQSAAQDFLGLNTISSSAREAGAMFERNLELLSRSEEPATKLRAALDLRDQLLDAAGGLENLDAQQKEFYNGLAATIRDLILIGAKVEEASKAGEAQANIRALTSLWENLTASASKYVQERMKEDGAARSILADLHEQNAIQQAINQHGEASAQVVQLRQQAERRAFEEMLRGLDVADGLKNEMLAAFDAGQKLANVNIAPGLSAAAAEARRIADELVRAIGASQTLASQSVTSLRESEIRLQYSDDPVARARALARYRITAAQGVRREGAEGAELAALDAEREAYVRNMTQIERNNQARLEHLRSQRSGSRASLAEAEAVNRLILQQQEELDLLRETDPVRQEMLRHRETLASATAAERAEVEHLITTRIAEQQAIEATQEAEHFLNQTLYDSFRTSIEEGEGLIGVLERIGIAALDAAAQAFFMGEGWMADLFGISGPILNLGGGSSAISASAASASIAKVAQAPLSASASAPATSVVRLELSKDLVATTVETSVATSVEISEAMMTQYDRELPGRIKEIGDDPRVIG